MFAIACVGKKLVFHTEICYYFKKVILKIGLFRMVKNFFKVDQPRYIVSPLYLESKAKRVFAIACLRKTLVFHTEFCYYFRIILNK